MNRIISTIIAMLAASICLAQTSGEPSGTYLYCQRESGDLYLDVYDPAPGSVTEIDGIRKPTIIYMFGGGFKGGNRSSKYNFNWFQHLSDAGYSVVAIDYRLGLQGVTEMGINAKSADLLYNAIHLAVEDLFAATKFLLENADQLGINASSLVVSGSSAGAMAALQAEWEICNGSAGTDILPDGFNYSGVIAFSGAIYSRSGAIRYARTPCPHFLCHGTEDKTVPYTQIALLKQRLAGSDAIAKIFAQNGYDCQIWRFDGNRHEIANTQVRNLPEELQFLELNVTKGIRRNIDATVVDEGIDIPAWALGDFRQIYEK